MRLGRRTPALGADGTNPIRAEVDPAEGARWFYGSPDAPVTVVEFGDFECPYCGAAAGVLKRLVDTSEGRIRLVFRHFPLFTMHPHALIAALAAESAGQQGRFWEMHELLYAKQGKLGPADLASRAEALGLDPASVCGDRAQSYADAVQADYEFGVSIGVEGTPTIFVNGERYTDKLDLPELRAAAARALA